MQGKVVRRIALRSGCGNDLTENHVAISEIAPGMYRVYLIAGTSDKSTQGTEKSAGIVSKAKAVKLAEDLRDDRLRRGFRLTNDWQWPQSRYICDAPPSARVAHLELSELPPASRALIAATF